MAGTDTIDVAVLGGGPAGLSAALLLGRCRRKVAVYDEGKPRNFMSPRVHSYLGVADYSPGELLETGRMQLGEFPHVTLHSARVDDLERIGQGFQIKLSSGAVSSARAVIVATGLVDRLPPVQGIEHFYGKSVFPCPYCDGWENRDRRIGVLGEGDAAVELAIELRLWSKTISLFAAGAPPTAEQRDRLDRLDVRTYLQGLRELRGEGDQLCSVELADGVELPCDAIFLVTRQIQHHDFLDKMGCRLGDGHQAECDDSGRTRTPGLFVAGNAKQGLQMAIIAAADGLKCAAAANEWLLKSDS
jgi:thioredoxin reductase